MRLKVVSWNIWIDGYFDQWKDFLGAAGADIIGLQEVKDNDPERDVIGFLAQHGYNHFFARTEQVWEGKVYRHGPAIFSKFPIIRSERYLLAEESERAAAIVDVEVYGKVLHVFSTHLIHTHQLPSLQQESQTARLIGKLPNENLILMGDFNATPGSKSIQSLRNILRDTDPASAPTWSVYTAGCLKCNPTAVDTKLDYIFVSKDVKADAFQVGISKGSDHLPISVFVDI